MALFTKNGDDGSTTLFGGEKISKSNTLLEAYGCLDELNSFIGFASAKVKKKTDHNLLINIQKDLYKQMAFLAGAHIEMEEFNRKVTFFEQYINIVSSKLPRLNRFILPQGNENTGIFHILRTITRRAERAVVKWIDTEKKVKNNNIKILLKYMNRLSDLFFVMARKYNTKKEIIV